MSVEPLNLLNLPFDVRHLIYKHIFPPLKQIYILADHDTLSLMNNDHTIYTSILRVNRLLHVESAEYLYNSYLFNIVGLKTHCLKLYQPFLETFTKHARQPPQIHAFSNGQHSATSCLSIQAGTSQLTTLQSRRRGRPRTIQELQGELSPTTSPLDYILFLDRLKWLSGHHFIVVAIVVVFLSIVLATLLA